MSQQDLKTLHNKIMKEFRKDLLWAFNTNDCKKFFFELMQQAVQEEVYDRYNPTLYQRREDKQGGLKDSSVYDYEVGHLSQGITVFVKNMAKGVGKAYYIDEGIVRGKDFYDWEESLIYQLQENGGFPRDFYGHMETLVKKDHDRLRKILIKKLETKGWKLN